MYLVFDIGGTKMRLAKSLNGKTFEPPKIIPTPQDFEQAMRALAALAIAVGGGQKIVTAAGGAPGPMDRKHNFLLNAPNLPRWRGKPLRRRLQQAFGAPVFLENDSAVVGLGEAAVGAGKGYNPVAYITISTGVGGARIVNGKIDFNALGFEPGHQIVDLDGSLDAGYNLKGTLEGYVSGAALKARYGKLPTEISDARVWNVWAKRLAVGINNTIVHWSPEAVVLGGSIITRGPGGLLSKVSAELNKTLKIFPRPPKLIKAALGDFGGLYGALELIKQNL